LSTVTMKNPRWKRNDAKSVVIMSLKDLLTPFCEFELGKKIHLFNKSLIDYKFYLSKAQPSEADAIIFFEYTNPPLCS
jgi:hypothetical protein